MANAEGAKAQIIGQVFIFILAGLVFVLIITYGYKAVTYFIERQEQVTLLDFRTDLETGVEGVKRDYGSVRKLDLKLPSKYSGVCFFDFSSAICDPKMPSANPALRLSSQTIDMRWAENACKLKNADVFIVPRAQDMDLADIQVDAGYVCIPNSGVISLKLEGTGKKAKISPWSP